ncbi:hypothetical protein [Muricoccus radiodurans]|uniref:hypothetical protein n=1 Tax=Muricoccus radiodurans TaxID=2231721 RepID=UPI003CF07F8F
MLDGTDALFLIGTVEDAVLRAPVEVPLLTEAGWPRACRVAVPRLQPALNDNAAPDTPTCPVAVEEIVAIRCLGGRHHLGSVLALGRIPAGGEAIPQARAMETLLQLLAYYGQWMGFEGRCRSASIGRSLLTEVHSAAGRIEYAVDIRKVHRKEQRLVADGSALFEGRTIARLERMEVEFGA